MKILKNNFSTNLLNQLFNVTEEITLTPGEVLFFDEKNTEKPLEYEDD